jgi:hypothetical protein
MSLRGYQKCLGCMSRAFRSNESLDVRSTGSLTRKCSGIALPLLVLGAQSAARRRQRVGSARHRLAVTLPGGSVALAVARIPRDGADPRLRAVVRVDGRGGGRRDGRGQQLAAVGAAEGGMRVGAPLGRLGTEEGSRIGRVGGIVALPAVGHGLASHC